MAVQVPVYDVGIVGAGFGGVIAAIEMQRRGRGQFILFERGQEIGGVWRDNVYPGCACDVRSHLYSIESEPNPNWSTSYAKQPEILQYLKSVVERRGLERHILRGVEIVESRFSAGEGQWRLRDAQGRQWAARSLILATGPQNRPHKPKLPGLERFAGQVVHSASWDTSAQLAGRRVAVVGTGASAVQIVPNIAAQVQSLRVFQRSAPWILPRLDRPIGPLARRLYAAAPAAQRAVRTALYWSMELAGLGFLGNRMVHRALTRIALRKLAAEVADPGVRAKLTPDYELGCKRVLVSDDYWPAFNRPNVHLITAPIGEVTEAGIRTADGQMHDCDVIVLATGFNVADPDGLLPVIGLDGRVMEEEWRTAPEAFLGIHAAGYPNLSLLLGPNSGLGHSSALHVMESQMVYIAQYLDELERLGPGRALDVKREAQTRFCTDVQARLQKTVWASGCRSWYMNRAGRNTAIYPGLTNDYRQATRRFEAGNYRVVDAGEPESARAAGGQRASSQAAP